MEDLGHLIETILEAEATSACFCKAFHVLKGWLTSAKEGERERALQVCTHVLGACKERCELTRGCSYKQFGSLVGLLGSLTSDCLDTCHQRAWVCLDYLLQMQAKSMKVPQADEIRCLYEELNSPDTETVAETCTQITKAVCRCIPAAQAVDFLTAILDSLLHVTRPRARAVGKWVFIFLVECREEIVQEVPKILSTLYSYVQQSTHRPFVLRAVFLLTRFHQEPVISSLLQKSLLMDSDTVELWRSLGRSILGIQILRCLVEKLNRAGNDRLGTDSSTCEQHSCQTALETLKITRAISEVVFDLRSTEELMQLLPHLLPSLLRWASEMLGGERQLLLMTSWKQLHVEKPCRIFLSAIKLVLGKCMGQRWMQLLEIWGVWARLEDPVAHPQGVRLLISSLKGSTCFRLAQSFLKVFLGKGEDGPQLHAEALSPKGGVRCLATSTQQSLGSQPIAFEEAGARHVMDRWSSHCRGEGKTPSPHPTDFPLASTAQHRLIVLGQSGKILTPPWREAPQPAKPFLSFLAALCSCVRSQSRPARSEDRGGVTGTVPAAVTTFVAVGTSLLKRLQDHEGDRVETYRELESVLWGDDGCLTSGVVNRLIAEALSDMRAAQGVTGDVKMAASDVLVALARSHFHFVMSELQSHLKAMRKVPDEIVLLTLGKMARRYALRCIPFVGMTLLALRAVLTRVGSGEVLHAVCSVLEQWSKGVSTYLCSWEQCPFPRKGVAQFCEAIYPLFRYVVANWLDCKEEEDKQAVLGAVAAMLGVLLHEEQYREQTWEPLLWLLLQCQEVRDNSRLTKSLSYVLEILEGVQTPMPQGTALATGTAVRRQLPDVTEEPGPAQKAVLSRCIMLQARMRPEETVMFLHSQLSGGSEAGRVAALGLLGVLARADAPAVREKLPQLVEATRSLCSDPSAQVRRAVLEFSRERLSSGSQSCWPWDVVGHIFSEFSRTSGRLVAGGLFAWENPEDGAIRALCLDIVGSLDVTLRGMTKLLWPRLLQYVVPAQYSGMLIPLSRCLRALVERRERAGCEEEEEEPDAMDSQEQGRSPSECCCWVWPGVRPARVSLRPTSPEQEPRKSKGQRQALLLGTRGSALRGPLPGAEAWLSCSQRSPGEPGLAPGRAGAAFISCWAALGSPPASAIAAQLLSALSPVWGYRRREARQLTQPFCLPTARLPAPQALLARLLVSSGALGKELFWPGVVGDPGVEMLLRPVPGAPKEEAACPSPSGIPLRSQGWQHPGSLLGEAVVAAAPYPSRERAVAALQLLQALHGRIHRGLGAAWATEIPLLLQYLEGRTESSLASAEWERRVLKFLRASLEPVEDKAWTVGLSQELSQRLGSSAAGSWEKLFLYKALGTVLAACQDLRHVQGQVLRFLQETNPVELSEAKGMISVVSHAAESHFHLVLGTVTMFSAAFTKDWSRQASTGWEVRE
ncbi:uncharacterized protein LOC142030481 [Buteo buteo]|uniref:uncharacterized protein LOC142030481 n=1 Tax=Buteo buteo TaxID=30397 RepID=UPI003EB96A51